MQSQQQFSDHHQEVNQEQRYSSPREESNIYTVESTYEQGEKLQTKEKRSRRRFLLGGVSIVSFILGGGVGASLYAATQQKAHVSTPQNTQKPLGENLVASATSPTGRYQAALYENGTTTYFN